MYNIPRQTIYLHSLTFIHIIYKICIPTWLVNIYGNLYYILVYICVHIFIMLLGSFPDEKYETKKNVYTYYYFSGKKDEILCTAAD